MNSANARDCLLHLSRAKLSEREDLVRLNDQFVDIIEHFHYVEAEHAALEHDYNLLKTGVQSDSSGINEIYEVEIRNVRSGIDDINRNRQQLLNEETLLSQQVKEAEQQWRHTAQAAFGIPKEVDEEFARICQIKYENCITLKRTKYMEEKNRVTKQNNGRIFEQINLMRMRKDQAVSLQQEYLLRKNELLNSIRNMEEDNKKIIMNEHKYFTRDRTADRHVFRDQLRQSIADIRADYEFKRLRNEEEIRVRLEREVARINSNPTISVVWDKLKDELSIVKTNCSGLQQQVSNVEIRNATLTQQIELLRLEIAENNQSFEISLESKIKEIEKLREQCTSISVELEKLCDLNIDLEKEIAVYRRLLDNSGPVNAHTGSTSTLVHNLNRHNNTFVNERSSIRTDSVVGSVTERIVPHHTPYVPPTPPPARPIEPVRQTVITTDYNIHRDRSPIRPIYSPYQSESAASVIDTHSVNYPPISIPPPPTIPLPPTPLPAAPIIPLPSVPTPAAYNSYENRSRLDTRDSYINHSRPSSVHRTPSPGYGLRRTYDHIYEPHTPSSPRPAVDTRIESTNIKATTTVQEGSRDGYRIGDGTYVSHLSQPDTGRRSVINEQRITTEYPRTSFPPITPIADRIQTSYDRYGPGYKSNGSGYKSHYDHVREQTSHSVSSSVNDSLHFRHDSPAPKVPFRPEATQDYQHGRIEESSSTDSVDEDNFQRFTRWYKGRVKISDVTPDYVQLVNRSSKKPADIGGFRLIHEYGKKSVYVDLPSGFILKPKDCLKIYARNAQHERGAVVAEIDQFDTTIHTNTSIRNTNNEVKSWFVYTSNTEIGDADHHHH